MGKGPIDSFVNSHKSSRSSGIHIKKSHEGLLHKDTGTPLGQKIPMSKIKQAEHSKNPAVRKRADFADTAENKFSHVHVHVHMHKKKGK